MANFVTGNVTPYFFGKNVSRVTFRVTGVFSENCHGLVKRCHVEKKNADNGWYWLESVPVSTEGRVENQK